MRALPYLHEKLVHSGTHTTREITRMAAEIERDPTGPLAQWLAGLVEAERKLLVLRLEFLDRISAPPDAIDAMREAPPMMCRH